MKRFLCVSLLTIVVGSLGSYAVDSPATKFLEFIKNIDSITREQNAVVRTDNSIARVEELFKTINILFARGAFAHLPQIKSNFDSIFKGYDFSQWPTPATVRSWRDTIKQYKKLLVQTYFTSSSITNRIDLDHQALDTIELFCSLLLQNILTEDFFGFSFSELVLDTMFIQPLEFTIDHPYLVIGGILVCAGIGYYGYNYIEFQQEESEIAALIKENKARLTMAAPQQEIDATIWAMYRMWCVKKANGNMKRYEKLASNDKIYAHFKSDVNVYLKNCI